MPAHPSFEEASELPDGCQASLTHLPIPLLEDIASRVLHLDARAFGQLRCTCAALLQACHSVTQQAENMDINPLVSTVAPPCRPAAFCSLLLTGQPLALKALVLDSCYKWLDDACMAAVGGNCPGLMSLSAKHCSHIQVPALSALAGLACLESLCLASCRGFGDGAALHGLMSHARLRELDLSWCHTLTSQGLSTAFGPIQPALKRLQLHGCQDVDCQLLTHTAFPSLQEIDLAFTPVGDAGLLALARTSPQLKVLRLSPSEAGGNLWSVGTWGAQSVVEIKRLLPALSVLHTTC